MSKLTSFARSLVQDDSGATAIEYGIMAAGISVVIIAAVQLIGTNLDLVFDEVGKAMKVPAAPPA